MDALTQAEVFALIAELNDFIENGIPGSSRRKENIRPKERESSQRTMRKRRTGKRLTNRNVRHCHVSRPK